VLLVEKAMRFPGIDLTHHVHAAMDMVGQGADRSVKWGSQKLILTQLVSPCNSMRSSMLVDNINAPQVPGK